jgi:hypothetical protein
MTNYKMDMFLVERNSLFIMKSIIGRIYFVEKQGGNALPRTWEVGPYRTSKNKNSTKGDQGGQRLQSHFLLAQTYKELTFQDKIDTYFVPS